MGNDVGVEAVEAPSTTQRGALARQLRASTAASSVGASAAVQEGYGGGGATQSVAGLANPPCPMGGSAPGRRMRT
uniref:Uncharacterized protein n=1 Tax=Oryza glaberrima TaxID=4538 RepID=I1QTT8_ORYGL